MVKILLNSIKKWTIDILSFLPKIQMFLSILTVFFSYVTLKFCIKKRKRKRRKQIQTFQTMVIQLKNHLFGFLKKVLVRIRVINSTRS